MTRPLVINILDKIEESHNHIRKIENSSNAVEVASAVSSFADCLGEAAKIVRPNSLYESEIDFLRSKTNAAIDSCNLAMREAVISIYQASEHEAMIAKHTLHHIS